MLGATLSWLGALPLQGQLKALQVEADAMTRKLEELNWFQKEKVRAGGGWRQGLRRIRRGRLWVWQASGKPGADLARWRARTALRVQEHITEQLEMYKKRCVETAKELKELTAAHTKLEAEAKVLRVREVGGLGLLHSTWRVAAACGRARVRCATPAHPAALALCCPGAARSRSWCS